ncbi:MAG: TRAP transporter small permease [Deltaproteobacteria bacterium]|nr:TRAP transporter small permease [Deltaproteobacteria bacterium]
MKLVEQSCVARFFVRIDKMIEAFAIVLIIAMVLIVFTQVMTRKLFNFVFFWSEEVTLLCLTWFSFIGIAIGFREKLHIGMDVVENLVPKSAARNSRCSCPNQPCPPRSFRTASNMSSSPSPGSSAASMRRCNFWGKIRNATQKSMMR